MQKKRIAFELFFWYGGLIFGAYGSKFLDRNWQMSFLIWKEFTKNIELNSQWFMELYQLLFFRRVLLPSLLGLFLIIYSRFSKIIYFGLGIIGIITGFWIGFYVRTLLLAGIIEIILYLGVQEIIYFATGVFLLNYLNVFFLKRVQIKKEKKWVYTKEKFTFWLIFNIILSVNCLYECALSSILLVNR